MCGVGTDRANVAMLGSLARSQRVKVDGRAKANKHRSCHVEFREKSCYYKALHFKESSRLFEMMC